MRRLLLGIHPDHLSRLEHGHKRLSDQQLEAVAEACRVPLAFLRHGFHHVPREPRRARPHSPPRGELIA